MNVNVATMERGESRLTPHTPCPLVQPLPRLAPKPTRRPAGTRTTYGVSTRPRKGSPASRLRHSPPTTRPPTNRARHAASRCRSGNKPPTIPLTPAIRPLSRSSAELATPIKIPPDRACNAAQKVIISSNLDSRMRSIGHSRDVVDDPLGDSGDGTTESAGFAKSGTPVASATLTGTDRLRKDT